MIGKIIDRYKIVDKLGEGGMGSVWKAEDSKLNRLVALKTLSPPLAENEEARERFTREAQAASALNHPNITTVHDLLDSDGQHFICMEYVEGKTLRQMVEGSRISVKKAVDIILQAAEALEAAHDQGILHRDIKSANIMVNVKGRVKVMDFGLAHLEDRSQLTRTGTTMGTLAYSSPEQITGAPVDKRSEVYSLGIVFYELVTGQLPFTGTNEAETLYAILNNEPARISTFNEDLSTDVVAVIEQMLQKDPSRRYESCDELIKDLNTVALKIETSDLPASPIVKAVRVRRRRKFLIRILPIVVGVSLIAIILGAILGQRDQLDLNRIVIVVLDTEPTDAALRRIADDTAMSLMGRIQSEGLVRNVFRGEEVLLGIADRHTREGTKSVLEALARRVQVGTVVTIVCNQGEVETFQLRTAVHDMVGGEDLPHIQVIGTAGNPEETITGVVDNTLAYVATHLDLFTGPMAHVISLPDNYSAFQSFREGKNLFDNSMYLESITPFFRAWEQDQDFFIPLFLAGCAFGNVDDFADPRADSLLAKMQQLRPAMGPLDKLGVDWLIHSRNDNWGERYQAALEAARLAPMSEQVGGASQAAAAINYIHEAARLGSLNLRRLENDPRGNPRSFMPTWRNVGNFLYMLGEHRKELKIVRRGMELFPREILLMAAEARALAALGRTSSALSGAEECLRYPGVPLAKRMSYAIGVAKVFNAHGNQTGLHEILLRTQRFHDAQPDSMKRTSSVLIQAGMVHYLLGNWDEAEGIFRGLLENSRNEDDVLTLTGRCALVSAQKGDTTEAHRLSTQIGMMTNVSNSWINSIWQARIASVLGDQDWAIDLLQVALSQGYNSWMALYTDPDFVPLHDNDKYCALREPKG
ncbi:serine/threonine protein kinase [Gemmatimonadota bacterium]